MMPFRRFSIHQPQGITEAADMLRHYGEKGALYAGGTEILLAMKHDLLRYEHLVDVKTIPGLNKIELQDSYLKIGATATHQAVERSSLVREHAPVIAGMAARIANVRVRATGTLGGNLCFAEPHSDPATLFLSLEARARIHGRAGEKTLAVDEVIAGAYETALGSVELLTAIEVPIAAESQRAAYLKFQIHERPLLGLALVLDLDDGANVIRKARAAVGSVSPRPCRSDKADELLLGPIEKVERQLADAGDALADAAELVDDLEGGADYKRNLIRVFLRRA
ncbi:MAG: FAD binding domain-containing protein, partial [Candidatus Binatia bacterium]